MVNKSPIVPDWRLRRDNPYKVRLSLEDRAKLKGLVVYDTALPHEWFMDALRKSGINPAGHVVWSYDGGSIFGRPVALSVEGEEVLRIMDSTDEIVRIMDSTKEVY